MAGLAMNREILFGGIVKDPEFVGSLEAAQHIFPIAANNDWHEGVSKNKQKSTWLQVMAFNKKALAIAQTHLKNGFKVLPKRNLAFSEYLIEGAVKKISTAILVESFSSLIFLESGPP